MLEDQHWSLEISTPVSWKTSIADLYKDFLTWDLNSSTWSNPHTGSSHRSRLPPGSYWKTYFNHWKTQHLLLRSWWDMCHSIKDHTRRVKLSHINYNHVRRGKNSTTKGDIHILIYFHNIVFFQAYSLP